MARGSELPEAAIKARHALWKWMASCRFRGWDPYDGLHVMGPASRRFKIVRLLKVYWHKFCPINTRRLVGIPKGIDAQAIGMIVSEVTREPSQSALQPDDDLFSALDEVLCATLRDRYGHHCWNAHPFPVQMRHYFRPTVVPEVIGTEAVGTAALELHRSSADRDDLGEIVRGVRDFFVEVLFNRRDGVSFFQYSPTTAPHLFTPNVSAIAARFVVEANSQLEESAGREAAEEAFESLIAFQKPSGAWNYRIHLVTGRQKPQIDYHQGFILDQLLRYYELSRDRTALAAWERGIHFYWNEQFLSTGQGLYRYPRVWPANIHNQAQGIITFSRAATYEPTYLQHAETVLRWTLDHLLTREGYFAYLKYPIGRNSIPYLRWSNATMLCALGEYLRAVGRRG